MYQRSSLLAYESERHGKELIEMINVPLADNQKELLQTVRCLNQKEASINGPFFTIIH